MQRNWHKGLDTNTITSTNCNKCNYFPWQSANTESCEQIKHHTRVNLKYDNNLLAPRVKQHKVTLCALQVTTDYSSESLILSV